MATKSLRERLEQQKEDLKKRGPGKFLLAKEGTTRIRVLPAGKEKDWGLEVVYFYLGVKDNMAIISPATFGKKCAVMEAYTELSESKDAADRERASKFRPGRRFLIPVLRYKDEKGSTIDKDLGPKLMLVSGGVYQNMIELYLDDDNGDFTHPRRGYDLKIKRSGKGKNDTEYTVVTGKKGTSIPDEYRKEYDVIQMTKEITPKYEETKLIIEQYLNLPSAGDDDDDDDNKKSRSSRRDRNGKKRRRK